MKEKIIEWLDLLIYADQNKTLRDEEGNFISTWCSVCYTNEIHVARALEIAQICGFPFKIETREPGDSNLKYEISFTYRGYKFFCLEEKIKLEVTVGDDADENKE